MLPALQGRKPPKHDMPQNTRKQTLLDPRWPTGGPEAKAGQGRPPKSIDNCYYYIRNPCGSCIIKQWKSEI